ncbi:MAG: apolipoprotein N-acyltransferase [Prolixibacteraceae bacterium]
MNRNQLTALSIFSAFLLSLPWLGILPGLTLLIAFMPLLIVEDHFYNNKKINTGIVFFAYAFLCFWIWNILTTWWIGHASFTGAILVTLLNASLMATVWWLFHLVKRRFRLLGNLSLIAFWISLEYLQYNWDIEWPWLNLGNGFANNVKLVQWYQYTGILGGTLWVLMGNLLVFQLCKGLTSSRRLALPLTLLIVVTLVPVWLSVRAYNRYEEKGGSVEIIILQPNIDPYREKFGGMSEALQTEILIHLTDSLLSPSVDYVVGPETALPPLWEKPDLYQHPDLIPFVERARHNPRVKFVLGALTRAGFREGEKMPETVRYDEERGVYYDVYNAALQIDSSSTIQTYHKSLLVSGVEKMPYSRYFTVLEKYIVDLGGTTGSLGTQEESSNFTSATGLQTAPVICFESVFGEYLGTYIKKGAGLIFILTNDGWWKHTAGYRQHLSYARLRAVETRRSIARSANTGISAFINQRGDITGQTGWEERTAIRDTLKINDKITFYVRYGDYIGRICSFMAVLLLLYYLSQSYMKRV